MAENTKLEAYQIDTGKLERECRRTEVAWVNLKEQAKAARNTKRRLRPFAAVYAMGFSSLPAADERKG